MLGNTWSFVIRETFVKDYVLLFTVMMALCTYRFAGEDLASEERWKAQQEQCRSWLEQQITERRAADSDRRAAQKAYDEAVLARDKLACELERMEQECQRRINEANLRFNKALVCSLSTHNILIFPKCHLNMDNTQNIIVVMVKKWYKELRHE